MPFLGFRVDDWVDHRCAAEDRYFRSSFRSLNVVAHAANANALNLPGFIISQLLKVFSRHFLFRGQV
ncbi:MAG: hypothetical protein CMJ59_14730 [Planctomycetaceae bacterium]|nr:hypothetical protein [Planctomycetaceae bacterium]